MFFVFSIVHIFGGQFSIFTARVRSTRAGNVFSLSTGNGGGGTPSPLVPAGSFPGLWSQILSWRQREGRTTVSGPKSFPGGGGGSTPVLFLAGGVPQSGSRTRYPSPPLSPARTRTRGIPPPHPLLLKDTYPLCLINLSQDGHNINALVFNQG